jgi:predicted dehydrogenase
MMNAVEAAAILALAREKGVFIAEAMWPRYMPVRALAREVLASGVIGKPLMLTATLAYNVSGKERVQRPELGGGALLDLGVYLLNFVRMYCDSPIRDLSTSCIRATTGVDASEVITCIHEDGTLSSLQASGFSQGVNEGVIAGTTGYLVFDDLINPTCPRICRKGHVLEREILVPKQITGFEYQFQACADAISAGRLEPAQMPHAETLYIMHLMDRLRTEWGVPTSSAVK